MLKGLRVLRTMDRQSLGGFVPIQHWPGLITVFAILSAESMQNTRPGPRELPNQFVLLRRPSLTPFAAACKHRRTTALSERKSRMRGPQLPKRPFKVSTPISTWPRYNKKCSPVLILLTVNPFCEYFFSCGHVLLTFFCGRFLWKLSVVLSSRR